MTKVAMRIFKELADVYSPEEITAIIDRETQPLRDAAANILFHNEGPIGKGCVIVRVSDFNALGAALAGERVSLASKLRDAAELAEKELRRAHELKNAHLANADGASQFYGEDTSFWQAAEALRIALDKP